MISQGQKLEAYDLNVRRRDGSRVWINVSLLSVAASSEPGERPAVVHVFRPLSLAGPPVPPLRICLLGPIEVLRGDGTLVEGPGWRRAKTRALLACLSTSRKGIVHRDALLEALWPGFERSRALPNLNTTVYYLRRCLEPHLQRVADSAYIHLDRDSYELIGRQFHWVDVDAFESLIRRGRCDASPERAEEAYREALSWYRGEYLADLDADTLECWLERERLGELYLNALEELASLCARQGRVSESDQLLLSLLSQDPCRESAVQALMRSALARREWAAAAEHYLCFRDRLWQDLDAEPAEDTRLLYEAARRGPWTLSR
jgi:DNA-binding SARP family transcriptional activator